MIDALGGVALAPLRARLDADDRDPDAAQARALALQAKALRDTEVGRLQDPRIWASPEAWRRHVRRTGAVHYGALVDEGLAAPRPGLFEATPTLRFGRTCSGRAVPYTRAHRRAFDGLQVALLTAVRHADALLGPILLVQGGLGVARTPAGVVHGYSASLALDTMPWPVSSIVAPGPASLRGADDDARLAAIRAVLLRRRPRAITGVPSGVVAALRALLADDADGRVAEALRRIRVYGWSGMPLGPAAAQLRAWFAPECAFLDVASATEGPIGWPDGDALRLGWGLAMLGFARPGDDRIVGPRDLAPGRWALVTGSGAGWHGFVGGDVLDVVAVGPIRARLLPRGVDVDAVADAVGHDAFRVVVDDAGAELLVERPARDPAAVARALGAIPAVTALPPGRLDAVALAVPKLPWVFRDPALRARLVEGRPVAAPSGSTPGR